jgi:hypothetical protein
LEVINNGKEIVGEAISGLDKHIIRKKLCDDEPGTPACPGYG